MSRFCVKELMKARGIKSRDLAEKLGVSVQRVSNMICDRGMSLNSLIRLSEVLEVPVADLFAVPYGYKHWSQKGLPGQDEEKPIICPKCGQKFIIC